MFRTRYLLSIGSLSLALAAGCGGDDGGSSGSNNGGTNDGNTGTNDNNNNNTGGGGEVSFYMYNSTVAAAGVEVSATTDDCAGTVLGTDTSDNEGVVSFSGINAESVGAYVKPQVAQDRTEYMETRAFHIKVDDANFFESPVPAIAQASILALTSGIENNATTTEEGRYTPDPAMGRVVGAVATGTHPMNRKYIGCVTIKVDDDPDNDTIYYGTDQGLPALPSVAPSTHSAFGRFWIGNVSPGEHTITAYGPDGEVLGSEVVCVKARNEATQGPSELGNISAVQIYTDEKSVPNCDR